MVASASASRAFPAADPGFPALPVADLLASVDALVARIRLCFGISQDSFAADVQPLLYRYAAYVHLLPATADNYFNTPGGLLKLGLEVAFFSLQGTDAHIFSGRSTITVRRQLEPRWRQATFIGGLCCELHRVISHVIVTDASGEEWPAYLTPLSNWLAARGAERYFVRWRPNATEARSLSLFALPQVVPPGCLQYLNAGNTVIVPHLLASIGGMPVYRDHNVLDSLVRRSLALVIDRNLQANADHFGSPQFGSHLERYLVDALRRLAASNANWIPNRERSRAWYGSEGMFLVWPGAAADVQALLEADQLAGIPKAPETVLDLLLAAGVFERQDDGHATWAILPPDAKVSIEAVKLSSPTILLAGLEPQPQALPTRLVCKPGETRHTSLKAQLPPAAPPGTQYSLIEPTSPSAPAVPPSPTAQDESTSAVSPAPSALGAECLAPALLAPPLPNRPPFRLIAPLRLNPAVRDALAAIVETLNGPGRDAAACAVAAGLFVPLAELERRGIQPAVVARALADVRMLVHEDRSRPPTVSQDFRGNPTDGLTIAPQWVDGFDLAAFVPTSTKDH